MNRYQKVVDLKQRLCTYGSNLFPFPSVDSHGEGSKNKTDRVSSPISAPHISGDLLKIIVLLFEQEVGKWRCKPRSRNGGGKSGKTYKKAFLDLHILVLANQFKVM